MNVKKTPRKFGFADLFVILLVAIVVIAVVYAFFKDGNKTAQLSKTELESHITQNNIKEIYWSGVSGSGNENIEVIYGTFTESFTNSNENKYKSFVYMGHVTDHADIAALLNKIDSPRFTGKPLSNFDWGLLLTVVFFVVLIIFVFVLLMRNAGNSNNKAFEFGKTKAQLSKRPQVTFKDVAGIEEEKEEMLEIIDFLRNPQKYFAIGARIPKGILLVGEPGTGKTLLARAVAGEANVPFYTISGSDFVELFVGVGASRVRDMFKTAKANAPCIIFIDEIDAVGRQRGTGLGGGHDEREQTLNQLLVEMDGFSGNSGVIIMAATNRADILDPALLRPGRFDRRITISLPNTEGREQILKVHARNKKISQRINFLDIAKRTPYFSGADLENLLNEAALLAARENSSEVKIYHIDEAVDRVLMGPAKKSRKYNEMEKASTAYHEAGHAVIGIKLKHASNVEKITIIPRGKTGGYNLFSPKEELYFSTKEMLMSEITCLLAGRIAEELVFNQMSTGAHNDFERATRIARAMVTEYGMSNLGPIQYESNRGGNVFLGRDYMSEKNFSDQVALEIDQEVRRIIDECYVEGQEVLKEHRSLLDLIAAHLIEIETLTREDIEELVNTNKLAWWEKKKAKLAEAALNENQGNNEN